MSTPETLPSQEVLYAHVLELHRYINDALHEFHVGDADSLEDALERGSQAAFHFKRCLYLHEMAGQLGVPIGFSDCNPSDLALMEEAIAAQRELSDDLER